MNTSLFKKYALCYGIAALIFVILQFLSNFLLTSGIIFHRHRNQFTDFRAATSSVLSVLRADEPEWFDYTDIHNNITELNTRYMRLQKNFDRLSKDNVIVLRTEYYPSQVLINGKEIWNDGLGSDLYSQQRLVKAVVPDDYENCTVDIYLSSQQGFHVEGWLESGANHLSYDGNMLFPLFVGVAVVMLGAFFLLFIFVVYFFKLTKLGLVFSSLLLILSGFATIAGNIIGVIDLPGLDMFRIETSAMMLSVVFGFFIVFCIQNSWFFHQKLMAVVMVLYIAVFGFYPNEIVVNFLLALFPILCIIMIMLGLTAVARGLFYRTHILTVTTAVLLYAVGIYAVNSVFRIIKVQYIPMWLSVSVLGVIYGLELLNSTLYKELQRKEKDVQLTKNSYLIDRVSGLMIQVFSSKTITEFCTNLAISLKTIIIEDMGEYSKNTSSLTEALHASVAIKKDGEFQTIYNDAFDERYNFDIIEQRISRTENNYILFGVAYVDVFLRQNDEIYLICHISGIRQTISDNLKTILKTAYANIANAFDNLNLKHEIVEIQNSVFFNLANITEARSQSTAEHIRRVSGYTKVICLEYGMSEEESELVAQASMMHDLGKLAISEKILKKKGELTKKERVIIKNHVVWGYNILFGSPGEFMKAAAIIAQQHHEQWGGGGYIGLEGDEIHPYARIVAVADVFDALTSVRSYKAAWTPIDTRLYINDHIDIMFERRAVEAFNRGFERIIEVHNRYQDAPIS